MKHLDLFELNQKIEIMDVGASDINETPIYSSLINNTQDTFKNYITNFKKYS